MNIRFLMGSMALILISRSLSCAKWGGDRRARDTLIGHWEAVNASFLRSQHKLLKSLEGDLELHAPRLLVC